MGNLVTCFCHKAPRTKASKWSENPLSFIESSGQKRDNNAARSSSTSSAAAKKEVNDDEILRQQALAAVMLLRQQNGSLSHINRANSVQYSLSSSKKQNKLPRSSTSSSRPRRTSSSSFDLHCNQDLKIDDLETKHFVLVHGGGYGAWCWYKSMALLREAGYDVDAVNLTGSGADATNSNSITTFNQYVKPLVDFLDDLRDDQKVILVGHDFGGVCVSYGMEMFPSKVSKAIYIAAAMLANGKSTLSTYQEQPSSDLMQQAQIFTYDNGKNNPPTSVSLDKTLLTDLLFNQSPFKDAILASVSMRPMPFAPIMHKLSLSEANYGSIQRFYIKTDVDFAIPVTLQDTMIDANAPEVVYQLKGSDHSPFLSKPQALHRILVEISKLPSKQM